MIGFFIVFALLWAVGAVALLTLGVIVQLAQGRTQIVGWHMTDLGIVITGGLAFGLALHLKDLGLI